MIIFLYGEDTYRAREKLREIVEHYKKVHKSGLNLKFIDFSEKKENEIRELKSKMNQVSMFKEKKLSVLLNPFKDVSFKAQFLEDAKSFSDSDDLLIIFQEEVDKRDALYKFLIKNAKCQEFNFLSGIKLKNWIKKEFEKYNSSINEDIIANMAISGWNLWQMSNEIKKLVCFCNKRTAKIADLEILSKRNIESDIFKTIDAIASKDKKQALDLVQKHIEKGESPMYIFSMVNYQFRNLLIVKDLLEKRYPYEAVAKKTKLHPFVMRKTYYQSQKFSFLELKKIYQKIFKADLDVKTGKADPQVALEMFVAEI